MSRLAEQIGIKARFVFPVASEPVRDAVVTVRNDTIVSISAGDCSNDCVDLGNCAIIPRLVNAHAHLELSGLDIPLGAPRIPFDDWLRLVLSNRSPDEQARSAAIRSGWAESWSSGVSHVGDVVSHPDIREWSNFGTQSRAFLEVMDRPNWSSLERALAVAQGYLGGGPSPTTVKGLSPHSPYTASVELANRVAQIAREFRVPLAMHLAETQLEIEYLRGASNRLTSFLEERDTSRLVAPVAIRDYLTACSAAPQMIVVHGNFLEIADWQWIAERASRVCVAYCPRTHAYFGHAAYPLQQALSLGARVVIGTDSRASNPDLNLWSEVQFAAQKHPEVARRELLRMITINAAEALMLRKGTATLQAGGKARFNVVALGGCQSDNPYDHLFEGTAMTGSHADYLD